MSKKFWVTLGLIIGSIVGGYLPSFFGIGVFSPVGILTSVVGGIVGIFIGMHFGD